jgi:hypothetical protein
VAQDTDFQQVRYHSAPRSDRVPEWPRRVNGAGGSIARIQTRISDFDLEALIIDFIAFLVVPDETVMHVT